MAAKKDTVPRSSIVSRLPVQYSLTMSCVGEAATPMGAGTEANTLEPVGPAGQPASAPIYG
jgi:hypothetical protein